MMQRKVIIIVFATIFIFISFTPSFAVNKAGGTCKKLGSKTLINETKFECTKKGKILTWQKQRTQSTEIDSKNSALKDNSIWWQASLKLRKYLGTKSPNLYQYDYVESPNVPRNLSLKIRSDLDSANNFWSQFFSSSRLMPVTLITEKDYDFFIDRWKKLGSDNTGDMWWNMTNGGQGGAVGWGPNSGPNVYFKLPAAGNYYDPGASHYFHEMTHFVNQITFKEKAPNNPCWYEEGFAEFVGRSMAYTSDVQNFLFVKNARSIMKTDLNRYLSQKAFTNEGLMDYLTKVKFSSENCFSQQPYMGYQLGMFISEKLIYDFGWDKMVLFLKEITNSDFDTSFNKTFGTNTSSWYSDNFIPYFFSSDSN